MMNIADLGLAMKSDRRAVSALEYSLIVGLIVAVIMLGFDSMSAALSNVL